VSFRKNKIMKKFLFLLIIPIFFLTSCIEIIEETTINKDKSGKVILGFDIAGVGFFLNAIGNYIDISLFNEIKALPNASEKILKRISGIKNIKAVSNERKNLYSISFEFEDTKALNKAYYKLFDYEKKWYEPKIIKISNNKIKKRNIAPFIRYYVKKEQKRIKEIDLLKKVKYKSIYHLPDEVKKVSNPRAKVSKNKRTVTYECNIQELLNTKVDIGNKIKY